MKTRTTKSALTMKKLMIIAVILVASLAATDVNAQKIGYVDMSEIVTSMPDFAQADTALAQYRDDLVKQMQSMQKEFQTNANEFVKDSLKMSEAVKEVKRSALSDQQNRIMRFQQTSQQKLQQKRQELLKPIIDKAQAAISAVAKAKGYTYVLDDPANGSVLIVKPDTGNLTADVKAKLGIK